MVQYPISIYIQYPWSIFIQYPILLKIATAAKKVCMVQSETAALLSMGPTPPECLCVSQRIKPWKSILRLKPRVWERIFKTLQKSKYKKQKATCLCVRQRIKPKVWLKILKIHNKIKIKKINKKSKQWMSLCEPKDKASSLRMDFQNPPGERLWPCMQLYSRNSLIYRFQNNFFTLFLQTLT